MNNSIPQKEVLLSPKTTVGYLMERINFSLRKRLIMNNYLFCSCLYVCCRYMETGIQFPKITLQFPKTRWNWLEKIEEKECGKYVVYTIGVNNKIIDTI